MVVTSLLGLYSLHLHRRFTDAILRVVLVLMAGFWGLPYALWSLVFLYAFLANAFFLVRPHINPFIFTKQRSPASFPTLSSAPRPFHCCKQFHKSDNDRKSSTTTPENHVPFPCGSVSDRVHGHPSPCLNVLGCNVARSRENFG